MVICTHPGISNLLYCFKNHKMIQSEVINKLSRECCLAMGDFHYFNTVRSYIQMALSVGLEHYTVDMEEIVVLSQKGVEMGRFKSLSDASKNLGIDKRGISAVICGRQRTCGGMMFIKARDYDLVLREGHALNPRRGPYF